MAHVYENVTKKPITSYAKKSINKEQPLLEDIFTNIMMMGKDGQDPQP